MESCQWKDCVYNQVKGGMSGLIPLISDLEILNLPYVMFLFEAIGRDK